MRWKISHLVHDRRLLDLLAVIVIVITIAGAWFYFAHRAVPTDAVLALALAVHYGALTPRQRP